MDTRLLKAATSGDSTSMQAIALQDPNILLGTTLQGNTCLHISSSHGHKVFCTDVVVLQESLLMAVNLDEETPLLAAVTNGHVHLASSLLECCCQSGFRQAILQQDRYGFNALHHAIRSGHEHLALWLIEIQPDLSKAVTNYNESPMFIAVMRNFAEVFSKLLYIPGSSHSGQYGRHALHAAA